MVVVIVSFPAVELPAEEAQLLLKRTAPKYREIPGLQRKYFIGNETLAGGIYEWDEIASAENYFDSKWRQRMKQLYGANPKVTYFDAPCLVDNIAGEIIS